jgi:hypothetical protein
MFRLVRVIKLLDRWHARAGFSYAITNVIACMCLTLLLLHWLACIWGGVADLEPENNWITGYAFREGHTIADFTVTDKYNLSMYFCAMTLTGVGFGDIYPVTPFEIAMASTTMFTTGFIWAFVVGNIVQVLHNADPYKAHFQQLNDDLNTLMTSRELPNDLRLRCRQHLHRSYKTMRQRHQTTTLQALSNNLQAEVAIQSGAELVCDCIFYLRGIDKEVLVAVVNHFQANMFSPNEYIASQDITLVIRRGTFGRLEN